MKILLAEDDTTLRDTIAEALRAQGYEVVAVANGAAASDAAGSTAFDGAILDGLLPKMTGFDAAKQVRAKSPKTGVILMSGVFKSAAQQQEQLKATGARAFLTKPIDMARLIDALRAFAPPPSPASVTGSSSSAQVSAPSTAGTSAGQSASSTTRDSARSTAPVEVKPIPPEGNLLETPVLYLGWRIEKEQHSGILECSGAAERGRIFCLKGRAVFAQHSDALLHVGVELLKEGVLTPEQFKEAQELAVSRSVGIAEILKAENMATDAQIKAAYKGLVPQIVERLAAVSGRYRFTATDGFAMMVPSAPVGLVECLLAGVGKATEKDLEPHVAPRRPLRLAPGDGWDEVAPLLASSLGTDSLVRAINGRATIAQLLEVSPTPKERLGRLRQIYVLMSTMSVRASLEPIPMARPAPAASVSVAPVSIDDAPVSPVASAASTPAAKRNAPTTSDVGIVFSPQEKEARTRIAAKAAELEGKSLWEVLGVDQSADAGALKKAYFALSRDFHPDSFAGLKLGSAQQQLETVFATIQDAYAVLTDPHKRGEYEAKIKLEQGGGSSDIGAIFAAESDFNRIKGLVERGELVGAHKLIAKVVAVLGNSEEARGYKLFLDWWMNKNPQTAPSIIRELQELHKGAPAAHALVEFQGWIALETGDPKKARAVFKRVLDVDPRNAGADRGIRAAVKKQEELDKASQGGLGKLFKR